MKKIILVLATLFLAFAPLAAFAESPLGLPAGAEADAKHHNQKGIAHYNEGHLDEALKHFEAAGEFKTTGENNFNEALTLDKMGLHKHATVHFKEAKELANGNAKILNSEILEKHLKKSRFIIKK
jgi:Flp pilus assembly protein TadD